MADPKETPAKETKAPAVTPVDTPGEQQAGKDIQAAKIATLEATINDQEERIQELEEDNELKSTEIDELKEAILKSGSPAPAKPAVTPVVKIDKKKYQFKSPRFNVGGQDYAAAEVAKDKAKCAELFEAHPGLFVAQ